MARRTYSTLSAIARRPGRALSIIEDLIEAGDTIYLEDLGLEVTDPEDPIQAARLTYAAILLIDERERQRVKSLEEAARA